MRDGIIPKKSVDEKKKNGQQTETQTNRDLLSTVAEVTREATIEATTSSEARTGRILVGTKDMVVCASNRSWKRRC